MNGLRRAIGLLVAIAVLEAALVRIAGPVAAQARTLGRLGDPAADPVAGLLAALTMMAELLAGYLLLVVAMRLAAWLPGGPGRLAAVGARVIALPALSRTLDGLLGGVLLAQVVFAPATARAVPTPATPDFPPTVAASGLAGRIRAELPPARPDLPPAASAFALAGVIRAEPPPAPPAAAASALAGGAAAATGAREHPRSEHEGDGSGVGRTGAQPAASGTPSTSSSVPTPPLVPLPTWLGGSEPFTTGSTMGTTTTSPRRPAPSSPGGHRLDANPHGQAGAASTEVSRRYVIRPGDTLWGIAAAHLRGVRSPAQIDRYWRRIHAANRGVLGHDPNLIHPGTRLVLPPAGPSQRGGG